MADSPILPGVQAWKDGSGKPLPPEFFRFLRDMVAYLRRIDGNSAELSAIIARIESLEAEIARDVVGQFSVSVTENGNNFVVRLVGDLPIPPPESYYGTGPDGARGYYPLPDSPPALVPYFIPENTTYTVPLYSQALSAMNIDAEGLLDVEGYLIEVN